MRHRRPATSLVLVALLAAGGCGSGTDDLVRRTAEDFTSAVAAGDSQRACALLTDRAREGVECSSLDLPGGAPVEEVEVWGDAARVRTDTDVLFLRELSSGWHVSGAGCVARPDRPYACGVGGP
ncbi:hypothetical protein [Saccharothrix syringae]|uniref:Lipoprotein n=1 Tax=Saccharothrix syringae TaxID=103733 RepID=A0A5Q0GVX9_SACSY|nr:hypothetical protein [Saccharothrix syringae]QFZ18081.1 hypothetical protein EKG83_11835 [Saccharothrix syringae]